MVDPLMQDQEDYDALDDAEQLERKYGRSGGGGCCSLIFYALIGLAILMIIGSILEGC